jgi:hypothetical protein
MFHFGRIDGCLTMKSVADCFRGDVPIEYVEHITTPLERAKTIRDACRNDYDTIERVVNVLRKNNHVNDVIKQQLALNCIYNLE